MREAHATFMTKYLRPSEIDFLHGRVSSSIFMRNYFNPALINDLKERLDAFEVQATQDLQDKEMKLTAPIIEKARKAVEEVATENGYTYVFNSTEGLLLYATPSDDISDLVKKKLGITE